MPLDIPLAGRVYTSAVSGPCDPTPDRRANSIRRTSTLDFDYPEEFGAVGRVRGRARDLITTADGTRTVADDVLRAMIGEGRVYESLFTFPDRPALQAMVGARGPGSSRRAMSALVPEERDGGTPLYLLLDDLPGIALVSGQLGVEWLTQAQRAERLPRRTGGVKVDMCTGYQEGSNAIAAANEGRMTHQVRAVQPLVRADDPIAWHAHQPETDEPAMRRARRIDVWLDDVIHVDAFFQDSCTTPSGVRIAVHEYLLTATADVGSGEVLTLVADPRILPFDACPGAAVNVDRLIGVPLGEFRQAVLDRLPGALGCTHLNDALRALAEVPILASVLQRSLRPDDAPHSETPAGQS
ncbi:MAG: DUF2889 domain-containing protein [Candidatus Nanopelagicales bacterium]|nr:DUF2889 domain-containing protein [Candidatus Nanopelagicales bacterium]